MNANSVCCNIKYKPNDKKYDQSIRKFQGCPTIAVTKGGRIYMGWYSGGTREPHMENYNVVVYSDDDGKTWSEPLLVMESSKEDLIHALDVQLWLDNDGKLHVFWVQNDTHVDNGEVTWSGDQPGVVVDGYRFDDFVHAEWETVCDNPDSDILVFSAPRCYSRGFLRCKPTVLSNGDVLYFNYNQTSDKYGYNVSYDNGKTFTYKYGAKKLGTCFDEGMAFQMKDGTVRMFARCRFGYLAQSFSYDFGNTWTDATLSDIVHCDTRFFVSRTPSGNVLLVVNDDEKSRKNLTALLSDDDGKTWKYKCLIDSRNDISYPDVDFYNGKIYLTYDRERTGCKEILFLTFTEQEIIDGKIKNPVTIVSKP